MLSTGENAYHFDTPQDFKAPCHWLSKHPDEVKFCQLLANAGKPEMVFAVALRPQDFNDPRAERIYSVALALFARGETITPEAIAGEALGRARESEFQSEVQAWGQIADIADGELTQLPRTLSSQGSISEEAAKLARKFVAARGKRTQRNDPTPDEIQQTAAAIGQLIGTRTWPELPAHQIPPPALLTGEKPAYDECQLRELLYPQGKTVSLQTEAAHAARAALYIGDDLLFCPELGFLHFEPRGFWRRDDKGATLTAAKLCALAPVVRHEAAALLRYAATLAAASRETDARALSRAANELLSHSKQIERQAFLAGVARFLAAEKRAEIGDFAPVAWKFAFKNSVFDHGVWRGAKRDDFFLHVSPVELNHDCDKSEWAALLHRLTDGDELFARTLQDAAAYAVSGASSLRAILWLFGPRGTGKSTFAEMLQTLLGEGAATVDTSLLSENSSRERLGAQLVFKRGAFVSEAGNKRIEAELLKTLSGGDRLSVRFLYAEAFTAAPSHVLILAANDAPKTDAYDDALKDRVIALPFVHPLREGEPLKFRGHKRLESARLDPNSALLRGFAVWVAEGLERLYLAQEIWKAPAVQVATAKFWAATDPLTPFWENVSEDELRAGIASGELRARYEKWCEVEGLKPLKGKAWARAVGPDGRGLSFEHRGRERIRVWFLA